MGSRRPERQHRDALPGDAQQFQVPSGICFEIEHQNGDVIAFNDERAGRLIPDACRLKSNRGLERFMCWPRQRGGTASRRFGRFLTAPERYGGQHRGHDCPASAHEPFRSDDQLTDNGHRVEVYASVKRQGELTPKRQYF
jgi:hypothetical protein